MRAVIQRVTSASVETEGHPKSEIGKGLLVLLGIESADTDDDIAWLVKKICGLRIFDDENGVMNLSVEDIGGEVLIVSQFTLMASRNSAKPWKTHCKSRLKREFSAHT